MTQEELRNVFKYIVKKCDMLINNDDYRADTYTQDTVEDIAELCNHILDGDYGKLDEAKEVDLKKELESWRHNHFHGRRDKAASGEYLERVSQLNLAKYFFELGLKAKDWEKERMEECPYRQVGCTMYEGKILECRGACSWVVDYPKLKELKAQKGK